MQARRLASAARGPSRYRDPRRDSRRWRHAGDPGRVTGDPENVEAALGVSSGGDAGKPRNGRRFATRPAAAYNPPIYRTAFGMANKLVAGNWKLNGSLPANEALLAGLDVVPGVDIAVCVPFPYLVQVGAALRGIALGAQNVSEYRAGAYTGEVGAAMLAEFACRYVIVGHSERRALFAEDDTAVGRKTAAAIEAGLVPIVCVGETLAEREAGQAMEVVGRQLAAVLQVIGAAAMAKLVLAYEPVWAIGTGRSATVVQVGEVHSGIRGWLRAHGVIADGVRILYGGSVKPDNAAELFATADVDGGLIGGASLVAEDFMTICRAAVAKQK